MLVKRFIPILLLFAVLMIGTALRLRHLDADAPVLLPNGLTESALLKDEAAKCYAPRNRALFGAWTVKPADDYRYWETLSPAFTWPMYFWFKLTRPSYLAARAFSVFWSALSMLALYLVMRKRSRLAGLFCAALFAVNFYAVIYGRLALLETPLNALLLLAFAFQVEARERRWLMWPAALCWLLAWFVKQNAVIYLPALAAGVFITDNVGAGLARPDLGRGKPRPYAISPRALITNLLPLGLVVLIAATCFLSPDYRIRSIMNVRHVLDYRPDPSYLWMQVDAARTALAIRDNLTSGLFRGYFLMTPIVGVLAVLELFLIGRDLWRRRSVDQLALLAAVWWLSARTVLTFQGLAAPRFFLVQLPPTLLLTGLALTRIEKLVSRKLVVGFIALVMVSELFIVLVPWLAWQRAYPRELNRGKDELTRLIGNRPAVLAGEWAGPLAFDTDYQYYYLKSVFNRTREQTAALGLTHIIIEADKLDGEDMDPVVRRFQKFFPSAWERRTELGRFTLWPGTDHESNLILYALPPGWSQ